MRKIIFVAVMVLMTGIVAAAQLDFTDEQFFSSGALRQASIDPESGLTTLELLGGRRTDEAELRDMIGQMIVVGFYGSSARREWPRKVATQLRRGEVGGVLFMQRNIVSRKRVRQLTELFLGSGSRLPPLVAVDQEGGKVQRLTRRTGFTYYPSAQAVARRMTPGDAQDVYRKLALELGGAGFNFNLGPVVDLNINTRNPVIGRLKRSYGNDPQKVSAYAEAFIRAHRSAGVVTSVKHFPGHGSSRTDSHKTFVDLTGKWKVSELAPYRTLIERGMLDTIMVGHLYHPSFTGHKKQPATLSSRAVQTLLRRQMGFEGVVVTDDLEMKAISKFYSLEDYVERAIVAGNDILLFSNNHYADPELPRRITNAVLASLRCGRLSRSRISESYQRIVTLKRNLEKRISARQASSQKTGR